MKREVGKERVDGEGHWLVVAKAQDFEGRRMSGAQVIDRRLRDCFFGVPARARNSRLIQPGDHIVFYAAGDMLFVGEARVLQMYSDLRTAPPDSALPRPESVKGQTGIYLQPASVRMWSRPVPLQEVAPDLSFIRAIANPGLSLLGTIRPLPPDDYRLLTAAAGGASRSAPRV